jgi:hypothetical protein
VGALGNQARARCAKRQQQQEISRTDNTVLAQISSSTTTANERAN